MGVVWEEPVPHEESEIHEGSELDDLAVASALGVFTRSDAELEAQGDHNGNLTSFGFR